MTTSSVLRVAVAVLLAARRGGFSFQTLTTTPARCHKGGVARRPTTSKPSPSSLAASAAVAATQRPQHRRGAQGGSSSSPASSSMASSPRGAPPQGGPSTSKRRRQHQRKPLYSSSESLYSETSRERERLMKRRAEGAKRRPTAEQEAQLALLAQKERSLQEARVNLTRSLGRVPTPSEWAKAAVPDGDLKTLALTRDAARAAKSALVSAHLGLVTAVARGQYKAKPGTQIYDDLVQEGTLGLIHAVDKFDPSRGVRFASYATHWIRASEAEWIRRSQTVFSVPRRLLNVNAKALRETEILQEELGRAPTAEEIGRRIGVDSQRIHLAQDLVGASRSSVSLESDGLAGSPASGAGSSSSSTTSSSSKRPYNAASTLRAGVRSAPGTGRVGGGSGRGSGGSSEAHLSLADVLPDAAQSERDDDQQLRTDLFRALEHSLDPKELRVVRLRYGLDDGQQRSTRECAAVLGIAKETVRMTCLKAFRKLRGTPLADALLEYMD